jgi:hypothetical protein
MQLNLPIPDIKLINIVGSLTRNLIDSEQFILNHQQHMKTINGNLAKCVYRGTPMLNKYVSTVYQPLFEETIQPGLMNLINTSSDSPAFYAPHCDFNRVITLNFILEAGGNNVTTTSYHEDGGYNMISIMKNYNEVTIKETFHMNKREWYLLDVNRFHSVENIITNRFIFCLGFADLTIESFKQKYKHFLI